MEGTEQAHESDKNVWKYTKIIQIAFTFLKSKHYIIKYDNI